ncbi:MAG TPA: bifunctional diaminohydroxyphosphoribosylaminopyrimidine deaminase/5-amino-6-(5-phosphoribosylamino)uracil reductase RibD [Gemmatimonadota bacterium]|nr:bifunctional diaminohydroxyphosphoribosylaminopyrimidine deaminase/5-amino-6-(5-phosphoribosylamino)uracil reductase RibD [Gemmatimonadota bacterium]
MRRALELAERGGGETAPNPMVGCVLVAPDGTVIGEGYHRQAGGPHAEVVALQAARARAHDPAGATAVVTLEPCDAHHRTPACTIALLEAGVAEVVYALSDPHIGKGGAERLRAGGVTVTGSVLEAEARRLLEPWLQFVTTGRPHFHVKTAQTLNARVTRGREGASWVTGPEARRLVHRLRRRHRAVMVGAGTVIADDPFLTVRDWPPPEEADDWPDVQPIRVVLDSRLRTPLGSRLVATAEEVPLWIFAAPDAPNDRERELVARGVDVIRVATGREGLDLAAIAEELARRDVPGVLVEAGPTLATAILEAGLVDRWTMLLAPDWVTERGALPVLLTDAPYVGFELVDPEWSIHGRDAAVTGRVRRAMTTGA